MTEKRQPAREGHVWVKVLREHAYGVDGVTTVTLKPDQEVQMEERVALGLAGQKYVEGLDPEFQERAMKEQELRNQAQAPGAGGVFTPTSVPEPAPMASSQAHDLMARQGLEPHAVVDSRVTSQAGNVTQPGGPEEQVNPETGLRTTPGSLTNPQDARTLSDVDLYPTRPAMDEAAATPQPEQGVAVTVPAEEAEQIEEDTEKAEEATARRRKAVKEAPENKSRP